MIFHWSVRDSKSQISSTLLDILGDPNNAVVWIVFTLIFIFFSPSTNPFVTVPRAPITVSVNVTFMFHSFFSALARSWCLYFFSPFIIFALCFAGTAKSTIRHLFFLSLLLLGLVAVLDLAIRLYFKILEDFMRLILQGCFVVHLSFVRMVKFKFPVNHHAHPVIFCRILLFCRFAAFSYYMIVSSLSTHNLHSLFCCVLSIFALI